MQYDMEDIVKGAIGTISSVQKYIRDYISKNPGLAFELMLIEKRRKNLARVDLLAEGNAQLMLQRKLEHYLPHIIGEESLEESLDLSNEQGLVILLDMIDGTDLLERRLSNWCSAMVFYLPHECKILASFVARADDEYIYFARDDLEGAYKCRIRRQAEPLKLHGPSTIRSLDSASIAFYGQKVGNFLSVAEHKKLTSHLRYLLETHSDKKNKLNTRLYNLAGNPMMMRLIDGSPGIDAIFDIKGQAPHDVIPGAYIAQKAKAIFCDLQGDSIDLGQALIRPAERKSRIKYILTSTDELSRELLNIFADNTNG